MYIYVLIGQTDWSDTGFLNTIWSLSSELKSFIKQQEFDY